MSVSGRNCVASESAAADSTDGDDKEKIKAEAEADLENVFIYPAYGRKIPRRNVCKPEESNKKEGCKF